MLTLLFKLIPSALMLFWAVRIFLRKDCSRTQLLFAAGMLVAVCAVFSGSDARLFVFPFFFLAFRQATSKDGITKWDSLVLLPSMVFAAVGSAVASNVFLLVQTVTLAVWSAVCVIRYKRLASEYYDTGNDASDALDQLLIYLSAAVVVVLVMLALPDAVMAQWPVSLALSLFYTVLLFMFGRNAYELHVRKAVPVSEEPCPAAPVTEEAVTREEPAAPAAVPVRASDSKLLQRVIDEKLFLDPMISLVSLAEELHTNRTYLSNSIHSCYNQNFSDFINHLRIEYALDLMRTEKDVVNIKEVAGRSGYNHVQSFYRNFAQIMEMTPKTWLSHQGIDSL